MFKFALLVTLIMSASLGRLAFELCFEDTTLGGWIPFVLLTVGPLVGFATGRLSHGPGQS